MTRCLKSLVVLLILSFGPSATAATTLRFTQQTIPRQIVLPQSGIFLSSDTLMLAGRMLTRGTDYTIDHTSRSIDLSLIHLRADDTLVVRYGAVPAWAAVSFGRPIPEASAPRTAIPQPTDLTPLTMERGVSKEISISGAKTFRFTSRSAGEADFGQSLDLKISGELSPGVTITGALTDRGYDPAYGTVTSRLNELDKLSLRLQSENLLAQLGDIALLPVNGGRSKPVSGASVRLSYPTWQVHSTAARPKGRFSSVELRGSDRLQGPYRMGGEQGATPVVPGSETVWLDGRKLERGADKDYTVDYPAGQITFTARQQIDRRSRIEIDFEPLATSYRQELLGLGGSVALWDSVLTVSAEAYREGDDQDQLLIGELSDSDRVQLASSGDGDVYVSGIVPDSLGDYALVNDSLPDTVWTYVGNGNGQYRVVFTFIGNGQGEYRYVGGNSYQFVGQANGGYAPVRKLPRPERTNYYASQINLHTPIGGFHGDLRTTSHDRNLLSRLQDSDNQGVYYLLGYRTDWSLNEQPGSLELRRRFREAGVTFRDRLIEADFNRQYLIPQGWSTQADEVLHTVEATVAPATFIRVTPRLARLTYGHEFSATTGNVDLAIAPSERISLEINGHRLSADFDTVGTRADGHSRGLMTDLSYRISSRYRAQATYEYDLRKDSYSGEEKGERFRRYVLQGGSVAEMIRYERYVEDSLEADWRDSGRRDRLTASSTRQFGKVGLSSELGWQRLDDPEGKTSSFLGRTSISYSDTRKRTQVDAGYLISGEVRNERGVTYLQVEPGRGNYRLEDGKYVPDPFGDFIQIEELLSDQAEVKRGEKSFLVSKEFSELSVRLASNIREELLDGGARTGWWLIPFYTDDTQPYLSFSRRYDGELRMLRWSNFFAINLTATDELELRSIVGSRKERRDSRGAITLKQAAREFLFEQTGEVFRSTRDAYYVGAGDIDGWRGMIKVRRVRSGFEWNCGASYRYASSSIDEMAKLAAVTVGAVLRAVSRGEVRTDVELYRQSLTLTGSDYSYTLTDNHSGSRGIFWTVALRYAIRQGVAANITFNGRHSDDRAGRVTGRGEVVATF